MELKDIPSEDSFQATSEHQSVSFCLLYAFSSLQIYVRKDSFLRPRFQKS